MNNAVGTVFAMGLLFWIGYAMAMAVVMTIFGIVIVVAIGVIGFVYYAITIGRCMREGDAESAWMLFLAPALMAGVSLAATALWYYGGPSFLSSVIQEYVPDPDGNAAGTSEGSPWAYFVLFPLGLFATFGWIIPLVYAHRYVEWRRSNQPKPGYSLLDRIFLNTDAIYFTAVLWGILGGSTWAISGLTGGLA